MFFHVNPFYESVTRSWVVIQPKNKEYCQIASNEQLKIKFIKDSQERKDRSLASFQWTLKAASIGIHKVQIMKSIEKENEEMRTNRLTEEEKGSEIEWETPWWLRNCAQPKREGSNAQAQYTDKERQGVRGWGSTSKTQKAPLVTRKFELSIKPNNFRFR